MADFFTLRRPILVTCPKELSQILSQEIEALGYTVRAVYPAAVEVEGSLTDAMRLNIYLRTAHRVQFLLDSFQAESPDTLYRKVLDIAWEEYLFSDGYVSVRSFVETEAVNDSRFANQRLKDGIVDRMRQKTGQRPNSGPDTSRSVVFLHWRQEQCQVWLDTSGEPLNRRNYRKQPHGAPMQETLAAGVILSSRFEPGQHFINPMCGSGTLATEAALIAMNLAPGLLRENFGFMHVRGFDRSAYQKLRDEAKEAAYDTPGARCILTDRDPAAIKAARSNAQAAGLEEFLEFAVCDFRRTEIPKEGGVVMLNPEYGKRQGDESALEQVYKDIGDFFKQKCGGYFGYVFTGNLNLAKCVGLRTKRRIPFYNARIECRLLEYELYSGTRKAKTAAGEAP